MRLRNLLLLGAAAYAGFLAFGLPASVVAPRIEALSGGRVTFVAANGTITEGSATLDVRTPRLGSVRVDEVRWRWQPGRLMRGQLAFAVEARVAGLRVEALAARSLREWQLHEARGAGDAGALAKLLPLVAAWQPAGKLAFTAPLLAHDGSSLRGEAALEWREATLAISVARPLGSWRATLAGDGGDAKVALATTKGPLRLAGSGSLNPDGRLAFTGEARAEAGREAELAAVLDLFGPPRADGARAIEVR